MKSKYREAWDLKLTPQQWHAKMLKEHERSQHMLPSTPSQTCPTNEQEHWWQEQEQRLQAIASQRRKHRDAQSPLHSAEERVTIVSNGSPEG